MIQSAGIPLPAQTILMVSGFLVQQGHLKLWAVIVFATLGTVVGGSIGYWVSHEVGRPLALQWGRYALITPSRLQRAEKFLERYGGVSILLIRFVPGIKPYGALLAGINRMHWRTFLFYNAIQQRSKQLTRRKVSAVLKKTSCVSGSDRIERFTHSLN